MICFEGVSMKYECPVCKAELEHKRVDDGFIINRISKHGVAAELANESDGYDTVKCSRNSGHAIPGKLRQHVLNIVQ